MGSLCGFGGAPNGRDWCSSNRGQTLGRCSQQAGASQVRCIEMTRLQHVRCMLPCKLSNMSTSQYILEHPVLLFNTCVVVEPQTRPLCVYRAARLDLYSAQSLNAACYTVMDDPDICTKHEASHSGSHSRASDELHSQSCPALVAPTQMLQGHIKREAVQSHCSEHPPGLCSISLALVFIDRPAKCQLLQQIKREGLDDMMVMIIQRVPARARCLWDSVKNVEQRVCYEAKTSKRRRPQSSVCALFEAILRNTPDTRIKIDQQDSCFSSSIWFTDHLWWSSWEVLQEM